MHLPGFENEENEEEKKSLDERMVGGTSDKYFYIRTNFIRTMSLDLKIKTGNLRTTYEQILSRNASLIRKWKT